MYVLFPLLEAMARRRARELRETGYGRLCYAPLDNLAFGDAFANVGEDERLDLAFSAHGRPAQPPLRRLTRRRRRSQDRWSERTSRERRCVSPLVEHYGALEDGRLPQVGRDPLCCVLQTSEASDGARCSPCSAEHGYVVRRQQQRAVCVCCGREEAESSSSVWWGRARKSRDSRRRAEIIKAMTWQFALVLAVVAGCKKFVE